MAHIRDKQTIDMFEVPEPRDPVAGGLCVGSQLRQLLSDLISASTLSRFQVAARMSELLAVEVSKHQLDSWTAESRDGWRFPLEYLPAFEVAVESHNVTAWLVRVRGGKMLIGREALDAEVGRLQRVIDETAQRIKQIKRMSGDV